LVRYFASIELFEQLSVCLELMRLDLSKKIDVPRCWFSVIWVKNPNQHLQKLTIEDAYTCVCVAAADHGQESQQDNVKFT